jgi:predicted phosphodiesterase
MPDMILPDTIYHTPVLKKDQPDDTFKFLPLPTPSGPYPYRLSLDVIKPQTHPDKLVFHMVGDTGGVKKPDFQQLIASEMANQFENLTDPVEVPQFLYHLGDIVYHHGEAEQYYKQFFKPYNIYPAPIFAIAGNHDSDVNLTNKNPYTSLSAFKTVFCDTEARAVPFSGDSDRKSMIQPNIYWTLKTALVNIIGLHSNVPKFGVITAEQKSWFIAELVAANQERPEKALIVCLHHSPYSADINHGSSIPMITFLEEVFNATGIRPDIVFSGHVHNYQRFEKTYTDGKIVPFIVSGAGGFDELHDLAKKNDPRFTGDSPLFNEVQLKSYCENKHGFLKISVERLEQGIRLTGDYYTIPHVLNIENTHPAVLTDHFELNL